MSTCLHANASKYCESGAVRTVLSLDSGDECGDGAETSLMTRQSGMLSWSPFGATNMDEAIDARRVLQVQDEYSFVCG